MPDKGSENSPGTLHIALGVISHCANGVILIDCQAGATAECTGEFEKISERPFAGLKGQGQ